MKLSKSNCLLLAVIVILCILLLVCAVQLHAAAQNRAEEQQMLNFSIKDLAEKMGRMYEAAALEDQEWFEGALHEFQTQMQHVKTAVLFVDQTQRQSKAYRAVSLLFAEMPFVREESYNSLMRLPQDLQNGRFRTLYELLRDCSAETYDETMTNLVNDPRTTELLKSQGIVLE